MDKKRIVSSLIDNVNKFTSRLTQVSLFPFLPMEKYPRYTYILGTRPKKGYTFLLLLLGTNLKFIISSHRNRRLARSIINRFSSKRTRKITWLESVINDGRWWYRFPHGRYLHNNARTADKAGIVPRNIASQDLLFSNAKWAEESKGGSPAPIVTRLDI